MRIVKDVCGLICAFLTYVIIFAVDAAMVFIGLWENLNKGETMSIFHVCFM